jgi:hypothetical protein
MSAITAITTTAAIIGQLILLILVLPWPEILTRLNVSFAKDYFDSALTSIGVIASSADRPLSPQVPLRELHSLCSSIEHAVGQMV